MTLINANFADPSKVTTIAEVVGQCVLSDSTNRQLRKATDSVYGRALDLTRVALGVFLSLFDEGEVEAEGPGAWFRRAGESVRIEFEAAIQHFIGTGSPDQDLKTARNYQNGLVRACNEGFVSAEDGAEVPFHLLLETSPEGGYVLGGRSGIDKAIKDLVDGRDERVRQATSKAMAADGQSPQGIGAPAAKDSGKSGVVESIEDEELRAILDEYVKLILGYAAECSEEQKAEPIARVMLAMSQAKNYFEKTMRLMLGDVKDAAANDAAA